MIKSWSLAILRICFPLCNTYSCFFDIKALEQLADRKSVFIDDDTGRKLLEANTINRVLIFQAFSTN